MPKSVSESLGLYRERLHQLIRLDGRDVPGDRPNLRGPIVSAKRRKDRECDFLMACTSASLVDGTRPKSPGSPVVAPGDHDWPQHALLVNGDLRGPRHMVRRQLDDPVSKKCLSDRGAAHGPSRNPARSAALP